MLYETLRPHLTSEEQLQTLHLLEVEQREQVDSVKSWQRELVQVERGKRTLSEVATDTIDYLGPSSGVARRTPLSTLRFVDACGTRQDPQGSGAD